ncbi:unnamed protein product [Echinostoma caproni]|uniref:Ig-like domain-containing protein n=1 Tax=Echinostoma caproni TaxID=27848 RepID=A0A183BEW5_9TREM|nr:unnamed protein product [Echinostoma caproni]
MFIPRCYFSQQLFTLIKPDSGKYQCKIQSDGQVIASRRMRLDVQDDSIFVPKQTFQYFVDSGSNVTLDCTVKNNLPISNISWRRLANPSSDFAGEPDEVLSGSQQLVSDTHVATC